MRKLDCFVIDRSSIDFIEFYVCMRYNGTNYVVVVVVVVVCFAASLCTMAQRKSTLKFTCIPLC